MELKTLNDVYITPATAKSRYAHLLKTFSDSFDGAKPDFIARSPGRVNIIGDHIDYSYFPCLPAAIEYDVVMAVQVITDKSDPASKQVSLVNTDPKFSPFTFDAEIDARIEGRTWANYFKCSWITGLKHLGITSNDEVHGLRIAVSGNVPTGGGLSSSAAMVVTGSLAVLKAHSKESEPIDKAGLVRLSSTCEQLVGVNSGGLDQAASVFGAKDHALLVSFKPTLNVQPLEFKQTHTPVEFLIANSLVVSNKLETGPIHYNLRVVEVSVASQILAKKLGIEIPNDGNLGAGTLYGVLMSKYGQVSPMTLHSMIGIVETELKQEPYTAQEAAETLGITSAEFESRFLSAFPVRFEGLKLYQRAKHVYEETLRVLSFVRAMESGAHPQLLGELMNESQRSAEDLYENSHPDCEELCSIARKAGSLGSRITGAGWGGCTVHLVEADKVSQVREALEQNYYSVKHADAPKDALVVTRPGSGTAFFNDVESLLN